MVIGVSFFPYSVVGEFSKLNLVVIYLKKSKPIYLFLIQVNFLTIEFQICMLLRISDIFLQVFYYF